MQDTYPNQLELEMLIFVKRGKIGNYVEKT